MAKSNTATIIDHWVSLKAQIAKLEEQEAALRGDIVAMGAGRHAGTLMDAVVSEYDRSTLDMEAVREKLTPQFIRAHTTTKPVSSVRLSAKDARRA